MGGGQTSPADLRPRRGKGVSGPRSTAGGERGPWIGPDMRKRMNRDMEINGEHRQRQGPVRGPEPVPGADAGHRQRRAMSRPPRSRRGPSPTSWSGRTSSPRPPPARARPLPSASPWWSTSIPRGRQVQRPGAGPHPGAGHPDPGRAAGPVRVQGGGAHRVPLRRAAHRQADPPAEKGPPDRGGHPRAPDGPCEAAHRPAGQGGDRGAGRGRPDAGHGLCPGCDPHPGPDAQTGRTWACSPPPFPGK